MYQKVILIGRLGRDPEMRYTPSGDAVSNFSIAIDKSTKEGKSTMWVRVTCWRRSAEAVNQWLGKGDIVAVEGELNFEPVSGGPRVWIAKPGDTRASFEVTARIVKFIQLKKKEAEVGDGPGGETTLQDNFDDIPF